MTKQSLCLDNDGRTIETSDSISFKFLVPGEIQSDSGVFRSIHNLSRHHLVFIEYDSRLTHSSIGKIPR